MIADSSIPGRIWPAWGTLLEPLFQAVGSTDCKHGQQIVTLISGYRAPSFVRLYFQCKSTGYIPDFVTDPRSIPLINTLYLLTSGTDAVIEIR
jgi:hypothetical protein